MRGTAFRDPRPTCGPCVLTSPRWELAAGSWTALQLLSFSLDPVAGGKWGSGIHVSQWSGPWALEPRVQGRSLNPTTHQQWVEQVPQAVQASCLHREGGSSAPTHLRTAERSQGNDVCENGSPRTHSSMPAASPEKRWWRVSACWAPPSLSQLLFRLTSHRGQEGAAEATLSCLLW